MRTWLLLAFSALSAFYLGACQGPAGPEGQMGPQGPQGPQGETGPPREGVIIERRLSESLYDEDNYIIIEDERITPVTFRAFYLKLNNFGSVGTAAYLPVEYVIVFDVSLLDEDQEWETPRLAVMDGRLLIEDTRRSLLETAGPLLGEVDLAVLVSH